MKSSVVFNLLFSVVLAAAAYFLVPLSGIAMSSPIALAVGIVIGGMVVPLLTGASSSNASGSQSSPKRDTTTLYVGNLPYRANEDAVKEHFSTLGFVQSVRLMKDRRTGKRKGYGFVEMATSDAAKAIQKFNDSEFQDRTLKVRMAREKTSTA